jgi:hypothetical protein
MNKSDALERAVSKLPPQNTVLHFAWMPDVGSDLEEQMEDLQNLNKIIKIIDGKACFTIICYNKRLFVHPI